MHQMEESVGLTRSERVKVDYAKKVNIDNLNGPVTSEDIMYLQSNSPEMRKCKFPYMYREEAFLEELAKYEIKLPNKIVEELKRKINKLGLCLLGKILFEKKNGKVKTEYNITHVPTEFERLMTSEEVTPEVVAKVNELIHKRLLQILAKEGDHILSREAQVSDLEGSRPLQEITKEQIEIIIKINKLMDLNLMGLGKIQEK